jgi:hypothetical protein
MAHVAGDVAVVPRNGAEHVTAGDDPREPVAVDDGEGPQVPVEHQPGDGDGVGRGVDDDGVRRHHVGDQRGGRLGGRRRIIADQSPRVRQDPASDQVGLRDDADEVVGRVHDGQQREAVGCEKGRRLLRRRVGSHDDHRGGHQILRSHRGPFRCRSLG